MKLNKKENVYIMGSNSFIINEYITLKLVNGNTFIYVKGKRFKQCIKLSLNIQIKVI